MTRQTAWLLKPGTAHVPSVGRVIPAARPRARSSRETPALPSLEAVRAMPPFERLKDDAIVVVAPREAEQAAAEIGKHQVVGFDTESKPVFIRGQAQEGPHLVQFAARNRAWLFPLQQPGCADVVMRLLSDAALIKVGFGLVGDRALLRARFGATPQGLIDLDHTFRSLGYRASMGIRMAIAVTFSQYFEKSKSISRSDWSKLPLSSAQRRYAAYDAWGALRVYEVLCEQGVTVLSPMSTRPRSRLRPLPARRASDQ